MTAASPTRGARALLPGWVKDYVFGLGVGAGLAVYGTLALFLQHAFLPGLKGANSTVSGLRGAAVAGAYMAGGLYLILRLFVHKRCRSQWLRGQVYMAESLLLVLLIAAVGYVLWMVGAAG